MTDMEKAEIEKVLNGEVVGDDDVWFDADEYIPGGDDGDDDYGPGVDAGDRSTVLTSLASGSSSGSASDLPSKFSTQLPRAKAAVWSRIPDDTITDAPEPGTLAMDPIVLAERKARFRVMATIWVTAVLKEVATYSLLAFNKYDTFTSWYMCMFLKASSLDPLVNFLCSAVLDEAQYILADPNMVPEDLLKLPKISKKDFQWGCYFDLITSRVTQQLEGWYTGSATGFGGRDKPAGLIGRLLSYFPGCKER